MKLWAGLVPSEAWEEAVFHASPFAAGDDWQISSWLGLWKQTSISALMFSQ